MNQIFISHAGEDFDVVAVLSDGLEKEGFKTWYYERDGTAFDQHLDTTTNAISESAAVMVVISRHSIASHEVSSELEWAHTTRKPLAPVLIDMTWEEFIAWDKANRSGSTWQRIFGIRVGITMPRSGIVDALPRIVAGLNNICGDPQRIHTSEIVSQYPYPLAATYRRTMGKDVDAPQAYQVHRDLRDMFASIVKYLTTIVTAIYRQETIKPGTEHTQIEAQLVTLSYPGLSHWVDLLGAILHAYQSSDDRLVQTLRSLYFAQSHSDGPVADLIRNIHAWLSLRSPRRPPFSYRDMIDLLLAYDEADKGWASSGSVLLPEEYAERVRVIMAALERMLRDLRFLVAYPLVCLGVDDRQCYDAMGNTIDVATDVIGLTDRLLNGHSYLARREMNAVIPYLDLYPLLSLLHCTGCSQQRMFFPDQVKHQSLHYVSYSCSHVYDPRGNPQLIEDLSTFLTVQYWQNVRQQRDPMAEYQAYTNVFRQMTTQNDGSFENDEQLLLKNLARLLGMSAQDQQYVEEHIRNEYVNVASSRFSEHEWIDDKADQNNSVEHSHENLTGPTMVDSDPVDEVGASVADAKEYQLSEVADSLAKTQDDSATEKLDKTATTYWHECWKMKSAGTILDLAVVDEPLRIFLFDEQSDITVLDAEGRVVYRSRIIGHPFQIRAFRNKLLVGTWHGYTYCFGAEEVDWQANFKSPISAIAINTSTNTSTAVLGTWRGSVTALQSSGETIWATEMDDGISAIDVSPSNNLTVVGTYAGHFAVLDMAGKVQWMQVRTAGIVGLAFVNKGQQIVVLTRDKVISCIDAENQEVLWEKYTDSHPQAMFLSANERRLIVFGRTGGVESFGVDEEPELAETSQIKHFERLLVSPLSRDGHFLFGISEGEGLLFLDNRRRVSISLVSGDVNGVALSGNGRHLVVGTTDYVSYWRTANPSLVAELVAQDNLRKGYYTTVQLTIKNEGEQIATEFSLELEGPFDSTPLQVPSRLHAGDVFQSKQLALRPEEEGVLPVTIRLSYTDDFGLRHEEQHTKTLRTPI